MKKPDRYFYPAVFTYEEGKEIAVTFPDLDAATSGTDQNDALLSARELLGCVLFGLEEDGETIPEPSKLNDMRLEANETCQLVDVFMPSIRMAQMNRSVNRTVITISCCIFADFHVEYDQQSKIGSCKEVLRARAATITRLWA